MIFTKFIACIPGCPVLRTWYPVLSSPCTMLSLSSWEIFPLNSFHWSSFPGKGVIILEHGISCSFPGIGKQEKKIEIRTKIYICLKQECFFISLFSQLIQFTDHLASCSAGVFQIEIPNVGHCSTFFVPSKFH